MLKRIIMAGLGEGYREAHIANSIDFVVSQVWPLSMGHSSLRQSLWVIGCCLHYRERMVLSIPGSSLNDRLSCFSRFRIEYRILHTK
jgi:hypothetical protein